MALVGGRLAAAILNRYEWHDVEAPPGYEGSGKLEALFRPTIWDQIAGNVVLDFGCGPGREAIELAGHGAKQVIGLDTTGHRQRQLHLCSALRFESRYRSLGGFF